MIQGKCYVCRKACTIINEISRHIPKLHENLLFMRNKINQNRHLEKTYQKFLCGYNTNL